MDAKLVRVIKAREGLPHYFDKYEYECIDCGAIYVRNQKSKRIVPYCAKCNAKRMRARQEARAVIKDREKINTVLDQIISDLNYEIIHGGGNFDYDEGLYKAIKIIYKFTGRECD